MTYKEKYIAELAQDIKAAGFRVFLAESGTHGFYTDDQGSKIVSFQLDILTPTFSGNYDTSNPSQAGQGWIIGTGSDNYKAIFDETPPTAHFGNTKWRYKSLNDYISLYQKSSKFAELKG